EGPSRQVDGRGGGILCELPQPPGQEVSTAGHQGHWRGAATHSQGEACRPVAVRPFDPRQGFRGIGKSDRCRSAAYIGQTEGYVHFGLTDEQEQLRREVRSFAEREVAPHVSEWDEKSEFPHAVVKKLGEMGLMGVIFPEELGGAGLGYVEYVLAVEELSRVDGSVGIIVASHNSLCTNHIMIGGNDAQRKRWIPKLASGEWLGAWGLTEPGSGSDAGGMRTTAVKRDGGWVLNGSKTFITNGTYANCALVLAVTDKEKATHGGISAFVVEKGTPGFRSGKKENKLGLRASDTAELIFENCFVPDDCLIGALGGGFRDAMRVLDGGRISIAA